MELQRFYLVAVGYHCSEVLMLLIEALLIPLYIGGDQKSTGEAPGFLGDDAAPSRNAREPSRFS